MSKDNLNKKKLLTLPYLFRKFLLISLDILAVTISFFIASYIDLKNFYLSFDNLILLLISIILNLSIFFYTGQYKPLTKFIGSKQFYFLFLRSSLGVFLLLVINWSIPLKSFSSSFYISFAFILSSLNCLIRILLRDILIFQNKYNYINKIKKKVAIYGAGSTGANLQSKLLFSSSREVILFFDDDPELSYRNLNGISIIPLKNFNRNNFNIDEVLLAMPSLTKARRGELFRYFQSLKINVLEIPSIEEIASRNTKIDSLKRIEIEDLLGREKVKSFENFLGPGIKNENILVTGAGGSIGSQLCREIIKLDPKRLVLLEISEANLYKINQEIASKVTEKTIINPLLGDVCDEKFVEQLIFKYKINTIIHSAAYKHVPLVENNCLSGMRNNILSTNILCKLAYKYKVNNFLLISTDKAVRPTNIMGASKRLSELIVLAYGEKSKNNSLNKSSESIFSMVRFGNVLGSSGSVVPLFKEQIKNGGPLTITHPEIIRYFMTAKEASLLVLQAFSLANNQDLLLLDMGEPVKIYDLAKQMINLSGLTLKDSKNPYGDVEIEVIGLRPGEKLYEELLIDAEITATRHPLIYKANEKYYPPDFLLPEITKLKESLDNLDKKTSIKILSNLVKEWTPSKLADI